MNLLQLGHLLGFTAKASFSCTEGHTLASLKKGCQAKILGFNNAEQPSTQRLMQLGVIKGETVERLRAAPGGDPVEYRVMGYNLSLRRAEAEQILVSSSLS